MVENEYFNEHQDSQKSLEGFRFSHQKHQ